VERLTALYRDMLARAGQGRRGGHPGNVG